MYRFEKIKKAIVALFLCLSISVMGANSYVMAADGDEGSEETKIDIGGALVKKDLVNFVSVMKFNGKDRINNIKFYYDGRLLQSEKDFTVEYENNFYVGTAVARYKGIGDFTGEYVKRFQIVKMPIDEVTTKASFDEKGELVVSANNGSYGMDLNKDYAYTFSYDFYGNVTVSFEGIGDNYTGYVDKVLDTEDTPYTDNSTFLKKVTLTKAKNIKKKKISIKWKKVKNVTGYKLKYTNNKTKKTTTVTLKSTAKSYTIKKCKKKAKFTIKMRTYIKWDGKNYYGKWSKTAKVTIKK